MPGEEIFTTLVVKEVIEEVEGFKIFSFEDGHGIHYSSGQYLTFIRNINGVEHRRSYSITSSPHLHEPLSVGVKRIPNGLFSRYFTDTISAGDHLTTSGAGGLFVLPPDIHSIHQLFFLAAGSGITPIYSLMKTALHMYPHLSIVLVYSNSTPSKTIFLDEISALEEQFKGRLVVQWLFSDSKDLSKARLHADFLIRMVKQLVTRQDGVLFYICGPESYMRMCTYVLQQEGVDGEQIRKENFVVHSNKARQLLPPDRDSHKVFIDMPGQRYEVNVDYPDSILKAARKHGIMLPYSCEAGSCGSCAARKVHGRIWHSSNEVLTEKDLENGLVLTCTAHPVGGDVVLQMR
ncbi:MAG TPA: ferredoxin--NADP reductase [Flavisolibacter sp.]